MCHLIKLISYTALIFLISCDRTSSDTSKTKEPKPKIASEEWQPYVDSVKTYVLNEQAADSMELYFINPSAPEVISKQKVVIWKDGEKLKTDITPEFDTYLSLGRDHFLFLHSMEKTVHVSEVKFNKNIEIKNGIILKYGDCKDIAGLSTMNKGEGITIRVDEFDSCLNKHTNKEIIYHTEL